MINNEPDITVSIVNWNTREELLRCIRSVLSQAGSVRTEVIVVDNASDDSSAAGVQSEFGTNITLIANEKNVGFSAAHNQAIGLSRGRYILLLNPDCTLLAPDVLRKMMDYMDENRGVGMLGPRIVNPDGSLQYSARHFPTMLAAGFRHTLLGKAFPKNRYVRRYMMTDWSHDETAEVDWLSGAALMVRRETFAHIGVLDERFFMYLEDVDWCKRAHIGGWRVVYYPLVSVAHRIGTASDQNAVPMIRQHHASMLRYFLKYNARSPKVLLTPLVMLALWIRAQSRIRLVKAGD